MKMSSLY